MTVDELKLRRDMEAGSRAEALIRDPLLQEAFDALEKAYFDAWRSSPADAVEARERLWTATTVLTQVRKHLEAMVVDGKLAKVHIDQITATPSSYGT